MILCFHAEAQDIWVDRGSHISFFSAAPLEDIAAATEHASSALHTKTNEIAFKVPIKSFVFNKRLMQEHFNENYLESDKFPYATFGGKITEPIDWSSDGSYPVTVMGFLEIHGVKKPYAVKTTVEIKGTTVTAHAKFDVKLADHDIKIPRVVIKNIAEVVAVDVSSTYQKQ
ncbi:YceI-like domain-containing protein [Parapedobacter koreensis]|uniref:YceI-like domain-containing protein n=2 Tax=Parapedobacter koreensis TaxID=332977 RepID=A0A1H7EXG8_9SPHI|nr:YceI-like domain-containing protein [Parapedobacter koreensis]